MPGWPAASSPPKNSGSESNRLISYAIVTGASRGIGRAIALSLAQAGHDVVATYRTRHDAARSLAQEIEAAGQKAHVACLDLGQPDVSARVEALLEQHGTPAILVNNAGASHDAMFAMMAQVAWDDVMTTNLLSFYGVTRPVVRRMLRARTGRIVNMTSVSGQRGNPGQVNYAASKAGVIGATKALALELAGRNITVNAVSPGLIDTEMTAKLNTEEIIRSIPMGRAGTPEDVAKVVRFLCSDAAAYVTGQVIGVNGGLYT